MWVSWGDEESEVLLWWSKVRNGSSFVWFRKAFIYFCSGMDELMRRRVFVCATQWNNSALRYIWVECSLSFKCGCLPITKWITTGVSKNCILVVLNAGEWSIVESISSLNGSMHVCWELVQLYILSFDGFNGCTVGFMWISSRLSTEVKLLVRLWVLWIY